MTMLADWKATKDLYKKVVEKKKPAKTILFIRVGSGVEGALKKCDDAIAVTKNKDQKKADQGVKDLQKGLTELEAAHVKLVKELEAEIQNETVKETKEGKLDALVMLKKSVKKYEANVKAVIIETNAVKDAKGKNPIEAQTEVAKKTIGPMIRKGVADVIAMASAIKAKPTAATYNSVIKETRNLTTALQTVVISRKTNQQLPDPDALIKALSPYADGRGSENKTSADKDWTKEDILLEADTLLNLAKLVKHSYLDLV